MQSANATNNASDRKALNDEVTQLKEEINRVATTTKFNGTSLLDGSFTAQNFQVGANAGEVITLSAIANAQLAGLGELTPPSTYTQTLGALTVTDGALATSLEVNGVAVSITASAGRSAGDALTALVAAFDAAKAAPGNEALANVTMAASGAITSTDATLTIGAPTNVTGVTAGTTDGTETPGVTETGITNLSIATAADASVALAAIDSALNAVNEARGTLGAVQSRFENAIGNIQVTAENLSAARGRIVDADFAKETANLSRAQILQQAGTAMVAQANQIPQGVLALLR